MREFVSKFIGTLRDWYRNLGEYRQLQFVRSTTIGMAMGAIFKEFLGDANEFYKQTRHEFFEIRCCSLKKKDLEFHYNRMAAIYHALGGLNDQSIRQVYNNSLPTELQDELHRRIKSTNENLRDITLGEIHMLSL